MRKPDELLALHDVTDELFATLQRWFEVPASVTVSLEHIDSAVTELGDPVMITAMAMRKLQALRLLSQPGVRTSTDVVVTIVQDLDRALLQAPTMWLKRAAAHTDWDTAFAELVERDADTPLSRIRTSPPDRDEDDPQADRFRELHGLLHLAVRSVLEATDGEIRELE